jgi:hypothetical protein
MIAVEPGIMTGFFFWCFKISVDNLAIIRNHLNEKEDNFSLGWAYTWSLFIYILGAMSETSFNRSARKRMVS